VVYFIVLLSCVTFLGYSCGAYSTLDVILLHSSNNLERFIEDFLQGFDLSWVCLPPM
jgi:hypothetical protein